MTFRLLTYNIWGGGQGRVEKLARVVGACTPDLVLLQEATRPEVVEEIARLTGMREWQSFARQSLAYLSRAPVEHASWHRPRFSHHAFVEVVPAGGQLRVFGVHLSAVHAAWTERRRVYELRALLRSVRERPSMLHVLAGDFNTLAPGATLDLKRLPLRLRPFVWASGGRVRWRTVKTVLEAGYADAFRTLHPEDPGYTLPAWDPHVRLDYVFVPSRDADRVVRCEILRDGDAAAASDHLPVLIDLEISPQHAQHAS